MYPHRCLSSSSEQLNVAPPLPQMTHLRKHKMKSVIWRAEDMSGVNLWPLFASRTSNKCSTVLWVTQCEIRGTLLNFMALSISVGNKAVRNEPQLPRDLTRHSSVIKHAGTFSEYGLGGCFRAHLLYRYFKICHVFSPVSVLLWEYVEIMGVTSLKCFH